ncbi:MAG TPA: hypothetical protein VKR27_02865, partial [Acidimicrobiales bacterium]|nr:hypothetical protein [Acidimicrobiales bacterium]
ESNSERIRPKTVARSAGTSEWGLPTPAYLFPSRVMVRQVRVLWRMSALETDEVANGRRRVRHGDRLDDVVTRHHQLGFRDHFRPG